MSFPGTKEAGAAVTNRHNASTAARSDTTVTVTKVTAGAVSVTVSVATIVTVATTPVAGAVLVTEVSCREAQSPLTFFSSLSSLS